MNHVQKGFTLIEIMIVVAIIAILAAIAIPNFIQYQRTSREKACESNISVLNAATQAWCAANPDKKQSEVTKEALVGTGDKGYVKSWPTCKLGSGEYTYEAGTTNSWVHTHSAD